MSIVTRFAPSPTGYLHLGHAYSALFAARQAQEADGRFILRIEDIDRGRCRAEFEQAIYEDLQWLGLRWEEPVRRQSEHMDYYAAAIDWLRKEGLLYPCFCTRAEIQAEIDRAGGAPHGADGVVYPGTCRDMSPAEREDRLARGEKPAMRLDMAEAVRRAGTLRWHDRKLGESTADPLSHGNVVIARKDTPTSYHLSVTLDDHLQGVTLVTRGEDLIPATDIHRLLQKLLGLDTPEYFHHPLLTDKGGKRLAKRDKAQTIRSLREQGLKPEGILDMIEEYS